MASYYPRRPAPAYGGYPGYNTGPGGAPMGPINTGFENTAGASNRSGAAGTSVWGTAQDPRIASTDGQGNAYDSTGRPIAGPAVGGPPIGGDGRGAQQPPVNPSGPPADVNYSPDPEGGGQGGGTANPPFQPDPEGGSRPPAGNGGAPGGAPAGPTPGTPAPGQSPSQQPGPNPWGRGGMPPDYGDFYRPGGEQGNLAPNGKPYGPGSLGGSGLVPGGGSGVGGGAGGRGGAGGAGGPTGGGPAPQGPGVGGAPGGGPGGGPGKPAGNPADLAALKGLQGQYGDAYNKALQANQQRYQGILDLYHQAGARQLQNQGNIDSRYNALQSQTQTYLNPLDEAMTQQQAAQGATQGRYDQNTAQTLAGIQGIDASQRQAIKDQYAQASGAATNSLVSRGLGNWTVADSAQRGLLADKTKADINLTNQTQALTAGYGSQLRGAAAGYSNQATVQNTAQQNARGNARAGYGSQIGLGAINALADAGRQNTALDISQANFMNSASTPYPDPAQYANLANQLGQLSGAGPGGTGGGFPQGAVGGYYPAGGGSSLPPSYQPYQGNAPPGGAPPLAFGPGGSLGQFGAGGALAGLGGPGGVPSYYGMGGTNFPAYGSAGMPYPPATPDLSGGADYGGWGYGGNGGY